MMYPVLGRLSLAIVLFTRIPYLASYFQTVGKNIGKVVMPYHCHVWYTIYYF